MRYFFTPRIWDTQFSDKNISASAAASLDRWLAKCSAEVCVGWELPGCFLINFLVVPTLYTVHVFMYVYRYIYKCSKWVTTSYNCSYNWTTPPEFLFINIQLSKTIINWVITCENPLTGVNLQAINWCSICKAHLQENQGALTPECLGVFLQISPFIRFIRRYDSARRSIGFYRHVRLLERVSGGALTC